MSDIIILGPGSDAEGSAHGRSTYTVEAAAGLAGVHPDLVRYYYQQGVFTAQAVAGSTDPLLDDDAVYELRRIEHYRRYYGVNRQALPLIGTLLRELARLEAEVRFHNRA
jgi:hypothetical protein